MAGYKRERPPGSGQWQFSVYVGRDPVTRKKLWRYRKFKGGERAASKALAAYVTELSVERSPSTEGTVGYLLTHWMRMVERDRSPTTADEYWRIIDKVWMPGVGDVKLSKLTAHQLQAILDAEHDRGLSPASVEREFAIVRRALNEAVRLGWITHSPAAGVVLPAKLTEDDDDPPSIPELLKILAVADAAESGPGLGMLLRISAATGIRRGELCGLRWRDVDLERGRILVRKNAVIKKNRRRPGEDAPRRARKVVVKDTKTHQKRPISIDAGTVQLLKIHRERCEALAAEAGASMPTKAFVFSREPDGSVPIRPPWVTEAFKAAAVEAGVDAHLHQLRHLNATLQLAAGVPLAVVSKRLGHRYQSTTLNIYSHVLDGDEAAADVLGDLLSDALGGGQVEEAPEAEVIELRPPEAGAG
jgi:integrase